MTKITCSDRKVGHTKETRNEVVGKKSASWCGWKMANKLLTVSLSVGIVN